MCLFWQAEEEELRALADDHVPQGMHIPQACLTAA